MDGRSLGRLLHIDVFVFLLLFHDGCSEDIGLQAALSRDYAVANVHVVTLHYVAHPVVVIRIRPRKKFDGGWLFLPGLLALPLLHLDLLLGVKQHDLLHELLCDVGN